MQGTRYYQSNKYLSSIFQKQANNSRVLELQETDTPFHFKKREMSEEQQRQLIQKRIYENPSLYMNTHIKCQICNKYIQAELVNHHSRIHFQEEERIQKILNRGSYPI